MLPHIKPDPEKTMLSFPVLQALPKELRVPCFGLGSNLGTAPTFPFLGDFSQKIFAGMMPLSLRLQNSSIISIRTSVLPLKFPTVVIISPDVRIFF